MPCSLLCCPVFRTLFCLPTSFLAEILFIQMIFKLIKYQQEMFDNEGERTLADAIFFEIFPN